MCRCWHEPTLTVPIDEVLDDRADSASVRSPSVITGDLPRGCTVRSEAGASIVAASRSYRFTSYGRPSSSSNQRTRWERELFRWWTVIMGPLDVGVRPPGWSDRTRSHRDPRTLQASSRPSLSALLRSEQLPRRAATDLTPY